MLTIALVLQKGFSLDHLDDIKNAILNSEVDAVHFLTSLEHLEGAKRIASELRSEFDCIGFTLGLRRSYEEAIVSSSIVVVNAYTEASSFAYRLQKPRIYLRVREYTPE